MTAQLFSNKQAGTVLIVVIVLFLAWSFPLSSEEVHATSTRGLRGTKGTVPDSYYIEGIPFFPQEDYYCGPSSLASVLNFYGMEIGQEEIAREIFLPKLKGSLTIDMLNYAKELGFKARFYKGDMADLKNNVAAGKPLILFLDLGSMIYPIRHYVMVLGFNDEHVITYSGKEKDKVYTYKRLLSAWEKTGFGTLQVMPQVNM
ncbi:MAG: C39 family peptidase [Thermodesulfobacteriota bacterium]